MPRKRFAAEEIIYDNYGVVATVAASQLWAKNPKTLGTWTPQNTWQYQYLWEYAQQPPY